MANAPVQVILNVDNFRRDRDTRRPVSSGTDFFEGRNDAFAAHKQHLQEQVQAIRGQLTSGAIGQTKESMGYVKVSLQQSALAKSHRPTRALFTEERAPIRGSTRLGEIIAEVNLPRLASLDDAIGKAEIVVRTKPSKDSDKQIPVPSRYRCEVGAIDGIELWSKADRRSFNLHEAIRWLSDARTGQSYVVELFEMPPPPSQWDTLRTDKREVFS